MSSNLSPSHHLHFSTRRLELAFHAPNGQFTLSQFTADGNSWLAPALPSGLFAVQVNGVRIEASQLTFESAQTDTSEAGVQHVRLALRGHGISVTYHLRLYENTALLEAWPVIQNLGEGTVTLERVDSLVLALPEGIAEWMGFTGDWGAEFEPVSGRLSGEVILESRAGRSSKGHHPWVGLFHGEGRTLAGAVVWSGNWAIRLEPVNGRGVRFAAGVHDWGFEKMLAPGEAFQGTPVILSAGDDLNDVSQQFARVGRAHWYPKNDFSAQLPIEWNHWWPYEDAEIHEEVFLQNVETAANLGVEVCTLDAGWFGPSEGDTHWYDVRGDWHRVNEARFPGGIRKLADAVHARKMRFGIWCEIEALGRAAQLALEHPDFVAARDGNPLGYVCFGNPHVQVWAFETLERLITDYRADWIKLDFNLDPGAGCDRTDHGHQAGDGLYEHYQGYYRTLERVRKKYPDVVLENCSSGGLRIDLGMLRRTDLTFLSDPDYPVHSLQVFWGASTMLAPNVLLHWSFSHWRGKVPHQNFDPFDPALTPKKLVYYTRIAMLGAYGLSQKLPDLPEWFSRRIAELHAIYKSHIRRFVKEAALYRLTGQPRRNGEDERWAAFQYALPGEHLLFVFRLPGGEPVRAIRLKGLESGQMYRVRGLEDEREVWMMGEQLMGEGIMFEDLEEEESALLWLKG